MINRLEHRVSDVELTMKIRDYLKKRLGFSTSLIAKVKFGGVTLNGEVVHMRANVKNGDLITVDMPSEESENIQPIDLPLDILYEDEYLLAINKPRNMPVHPSLGNSLPTLAEGVRAYLKTPFVFRAVNRLDRDTSGIVIIAKNQLSAAHLSRSLKAGLFTKKYVAIVRGTPSPSSGTIDAPIEREAEGVLKRIVRADGKPSITHYRVLATNKFGNSLCEVMPKTGRTHQIRVHFKHMGHPLVNDFLYCDNVNGETYRLHCRYLKFPHPISGKTLEIQCKSDFEDNFCHELSI